MWTILRTNTVALTANPMIIDPKRTLLVVTGPTAVGKTFLTLNLAQLFKTEILSADSRQFYREMRIGTARPAEDEIQLVPHHFIGHISVYDGYNVSRFESDAMNLLDNLFRDHEVVIMTGGSGLYINAVCQGIDDLPDPDDTLREELKTKYAQEGIESLRTKLRLLDPVYYGEVDIANPKRLLRALEVCISTGRPFSELRKHQPKPRNFEIIRVGLTREKEELNRRINDRVERMMEEGLLEEARTLLPFRHLNALNTVGYKELFPYFDGLISLASAIENIKTHTRRYAKRQMTWFRKDKSIRWFHPDQVEEILNFVREKSL
jgi:tRNA dimethylallyltransferase